MRTVFFGSGPFGVPVLEALHRSADRHPLIAVVTAPDRPAGRGRKLCPTPAKKCALALGVPCLESASVQEPLFLGRLAELSADIYVVADFGQILSSQLLALPPIGAFNLHGSLLPRYRGAAPVQHAILAGEKETGVTLFRIEISLDSGPVVVQEKLLIEPEETSGELEARLAKLAGELVEENIDRLARGDFEEVAQDPSQATYAPKLKKTHGLIDWNRPPERVHDFVRAMNPWPKAYSYLEAPHCKRQRTAFLRVAPDPEPRLGRPPGTILALSQEGFAVACRSGSVRVLEVQREGRARMAASAYVRGQRLGAEARFTSPDS